MSGPRLACATYGGGHVRAVLPVLKELQSRGWDVTYLALTTAAAVARGEGVNFLMARDFLETGDACIRAHGERLVAEHSDGGLVPLDESLAYLGFGYEGLVAGVGAEAAEAAYRERGRGALLPATLATRLIDRAAPDIVLATNSPRTERALLETAKARGIGAVCINDLFAPSDDRWLFGKNLADKICVLNSFARDRFIANGQDPAILEVTGNPAFAHVQNRVRAEYRPERPVRVLYVSQPARSKDVDHFARFRQALLGAAVRDDTIRVTVRLHPSESDASWLKAPLTLEEPGVGVIDSLGGTDVVLTHGSTMGIEASLYGLPVLMDISSSVAARAPLDKAGFAYALEPAADLVSAIHEAVRRGPQDLPDIPADPVGAVCSVIQELVG